MSLVWISGLAVNGNTYPIGLPVPLTSPHLFTGAFPPLPQGVQPHGSAPPPVKGKRALMPACLPTMRKEEGLADPEKQQLKYCSILALGRSVCKELPSQLIIKGLHESILVFYPSGSLIFFRTCKELPSDCLHCFWEELFLNDLHQL